MKKLVIFMIILMFLLTCDDGLSFRPRGACVYGPSGAKACVNGTFESECEDNFHGTWYENETCP